jgi:ATP-dependent protease Clp ATPase subunit
MLWWRRQISVKKSGRRELSLLTPLEIYEALNKDIIGQHHVKISIAVGLHNHLLRCQIPKKKKIEIPSMKEKDKGKILTNLGQNFISNTDWMVKRDLVNLKTEVNQLKKDLTEAMSLIAPKSHPEEAKVNSSFTMASRMRIDEGSHPSAAVAATPLSLDAIRQSNLQHRDTYYQSANTQKSHDTPLSASPSSSSPSQSKQEAPSSEEDPSLDRVVLTNGLSVPSVRLDKTNILLLGPTGELRR